MRVDFYLLSHGTVEQALPQIAKRVKDAGQRMLVVSDNVEQLAALNASLWDQYPADFLAHGVSGDGHAARHPLLLSDNCEPENGARFIALADGQWREEALEFDRAFLFFDAATIDGARGCWRMLGTREDTERHFWKQDGGRWVEGP